MKYIFTLLCCFLQFSALQSNEVQQRDLIIGEKTYTISSRIEDAYLNSRGEVFESETCKLFATLCNKQDSVVLDVGANIGLTALLFGDIAHKVYAFEPSPSTFNFLETNIKQSKKRNIELYNFGLGDSSFETTLSFPACFSAGAFISSQCEKFSDYINENVRIQTIDAFVNDHQIDKINLIKLDVEGFETKVLAGAEKTLKTLKPVVILEMNHFCLSVMQRICIPDFLDSLRNIFPILLAYDEGSQTYNNLHNAKEAWHVMHEHVTKFKYVHLIGAFNESQLKAFKEQFQQQ